MKGNGIQKKIRGKWRSVTVILLLLLCLLFSGCTRRGKEIRSLREKGIQAMAEEDYTGAAEYFRHACAYYGTARQDGTGIDIMRYLTEADMRSGNYAEAAETLKKLIETDKKRQLYLDLRAVCLARSGENMEEALELYREAGEMDGLTDTHREALFSLGEVLAGSGDPSLKDRALELYREAEETEGKSPELSLWIGKLLYEGGDTEEALESFREGESLGEELLADEKTSETKADGLRETMRALLYNQAVCLEHQGDFQEAAELFQTVKNEYGGSEPLEHELKFLESR